MAKKKTQEAKAAKGVASKKKTPAKNKTSKASKPSSNSDSMNDWISSLAKEATSSETTKVMSKEDRKRKRAAKKAKRQEVLELKQQQSSSNIVKPAPVSQQKLQAAFTKSRTRQLVSILETVRNDYNQRSKKDFPRPFQAPPFQKRKTKGWSEATIQPRPSDYSGIGLARESLYISFKDPSFFPSLEEEFREHIPGFFGKQRTKAMKRQLDKDMLWRKMADKKTMNKKFKNMTPDQRVEAMLEAGML